MMSLLSFVPDILKGIFSIGGDWIETKRQKAAAQQEIEVRAANLKGEIMLTRLQSENDRVKAGGEWETQQAINSSTSWKDEFWTIILAFPFITVAISPFIDMFMDNEPYVKGALINAAIESLDAMAVFPEWYQVLLFVAVGAAFGVRVFDKFQNKNGKLVFTNNQPQQLIAPETPSKESK